ncbi:enoyl-CoA hydratase/isomerase family protein [Delitschia confertaspora ATCC 74209]|uniref:Enoyl-CoA hydratase/isomerase family protein n=1 Tax=Delitschia confertaspora ATCC 74209 TaxID=1513339 RepID=A0A9P4JV94_9PLEO|nr:enoyl-CoA hydratase/isomerase family protein [Delitschia confertaspora ATCC 74209]
MGSGPDAVTSNSTTSGVTTILIDRPSRRNAVDLPTAEKLYEKVLDFEVNPSQKVCILAGAYGTFCAGADLHDVADIQQPPKSRKNLQPVQGCNLAPMGPSRLQVKKPIIAAVSGYAVAGGLELSLVADIRIVEEDAVFGVFCRRWGVPLIDGGTVRLQAIVGLGRALDMILTGRPVDAKEALAMGLANRVVPKGKAIEEATKLAKQLLTFPQLCMNKDRASCYYSAYNASSFEDAMRNEFENGVEVLSVESIKGATKFKNGEGRNGRFDAASKL